MTPSRRRVGIALLVGTPLVLIGLVEVGFRALEPRLGVKEERMQAYRELIVDGFSTRFVPRPNTVFGRTPALPDFNSLGFRGREEWPVARTPGVPRIVCLGGSTTEGAVGAGIEAAFPALLEARLERSTGTDFEVFNCGTSGWDTSQSLVAFFLTVQDFKPDLVIVHHAINDTAPRNRSGFKSDYSHFWRPWSVRPSPWWKRVLVEHSDLACWAGIRRRVSVDIVTLNTHPTGERTPFEVEGALSIETAAPFRRNLESIGERVESWGGAVMLVTMPLRPHGPDTVHETCAREGTAQHNQIMRDLAREHGWLLADAERSFAEAPEDEKPEFVDLCHLRKPGNVLKAATIFDALVAAEREDPRRLPFAVRRR